MHLIDMSQSVYAISSRYQCIIIATSAVTIMYERTKKHNNLQSFPSEHDLQQKKAQQLYWYKMEVKIWNEHTWN